MSEPGLSREPTRAVSGPRVLAIDGHDAVGKTTLVPMLAAHLGGCVVRPFADEFGDYIAWLWRHDRYELADAVARTAIERATMEHANERLLVFDRHWLTMFTVLPERLHAGWFPLPRTILCWTDVGTTLDRLRERGEPPGDRAMHEHYCTLYRGLAERHGAQVVDTSRTTPHEAFTEITALLSDWALP